MPALNCVLITICRFLFLFSSRRTRRPGFQRTIWDVDSEYLWISYRKFISLNIRYLVFEVYSIEYKLKITVFCFYIYTTSQLHWNCVVLVSAHYTLMKTIAWILFSTHSTFEFLWTLNVLNLFTIYGLKFIWLYYYLTWDYTTNI